MEGYPPTPNFLERKMKKKVVIIGGGFAGSLVAKKLEKHFDVTLIDTKNYFEFTPGVLRTIVQPEHIRKIQVLHSHYLKRARVLVGVVKEVGGDFVLAGKKKERFDYLVIASGSSYNRPFKEQGVVSSWRASNLRDNYENLCEAKKVVIVGGGLVGVELAGEILWRYGDEKEIFLVHSKERMIERNDKKASDYVEDFLEKNNVKLLRRERIVGRKRGICVTDKGKKVKADIVFLCTGITPNYKFMKKNFSASLDEKGFVRVNEFLQVVSSTGRKNNYGEKFRPKLKGASVDGLGDNAVGGGRIFAVGDVGDVKEEKTAQNAERQGEVIVKNIFALESRQDLVRYVSRNGPLVISLGPWKGIFVKKGFVWEGLFPGLMKGMIEKWEMWKKRKID